jgi:RecB family exonuclease
LLAIEDLSGFVAGHVRRVLAGKTPARARDSMPRPYLELEEVRLTNLVTDWLRFESKRAEFAVAGSEINAIAEIQGLTLRLRLDRMDRLNDGTLLVIDYKSGDVSPQSWELPRPDDLQLPLYAGFAIDGESEPAGLVFAKVRTGQHCFAGRVAEARATLLPDLGATSGLVRTRFTHEEMEAWRDYIETMAANFIEGQAEVDPREYPQTCERCGLQTLCRIEENKAQEEVEISDDEEAGNE